VNEGHKGMGSKYEVKVVVWKRQSGVGGERTTMVER